jgi:photosystem II cytochrome c550
MAFTFLAGPMIHRIRSGFSSIGLNTLKILLVAVFLTFTTIVLPAAAVPDPYIAQYLKVLPDEIAQVAKNSSGETQNFNYTRLVQGKTLFGQNCQSCHVGGATLSRPELPLSLVALQGATPPRDTIESLVAYMRHPLGYDGEDDNYGCREIKDAWLDQDEVETIAAFVLRAAEKAAGWGTSDLF